MHKNHGDMGFKDLSAFNLAMLGKQGWKFQTDPTSLVSRIFMARYFPKSLVLVLGLVTIRVMFGRAFSVPVLLYVGVQDGVLVQVILFLSSMNLGF